MHRFLLSTFPITAFRNSLHYLMMECLRLLSQLRVVDRRLIIVFKSISIRKKRNLFLVIEFPNKIQFERGSGANVELFAGAKCSGEASQNFLRNKNKD